MATTNTTTLSNPIRFDLLKTQSPALFSSFCKERADLFSSLKLNTQNLNTHELKDRLSSFKRSEEAMLLKYEQEAIRISELTKSLELYSIKN